MTEAGIVSALNSCGHGRTSGGRASATFISLNMGAVGRSPGSIPEVWGWWWWAW